MKDRDVQLIIQLQERVRNREAIIWQLERNSRAIAELVQELAAHMQDGTVPESGRLLEIRRTAEWLSAGTALPHPHPSL